VLVVISLFCFSLMGLYKLVADQKQDSHNAN
jgi:hypothetical protein